MHGFKPPWDGMMDLPRWQRLFANCQCVSNFRVNQRSASAEATDGVLGTVLGNKWDWFESILALLQGKGMLISEDSTEYGVGLYAIEDPP